MDYSKSKNCKFKDSLCHKSIGDFAFQNCSSLKSFKIDKNSTTFGRSVFIVANKDCEMRGKSAIFEKNDQLEI